MQYKLLATFDNYIPAHIAMGCLKESDIECWLKDENTVTINPVWGNAVGGIKLMVEEGQFDAARNILYELNKEYQEKHACTRCGSSNIQLVSSPRQTSNILTALTSFFLGSYAVASHKVYHCFDCGHEYDKVPDRDSSFN